MGESKYVIVGGGMVAGYAAKQLVEQGLKPGELTILSSDTAAPYERPPLSKGYLAGRDAEESIRINPEDFYQQHGIELQLGCPVDRINGRKKRIVLAAGGEVGFEKLVIATGSRVRKLEIPGAELAGVHYLRSLNDAKAIRSRIPNVKQAVVIGSGFIAMEAAAVLAQKAIQVTMVVREDRIWKKFFSPEMSDFFEKYYQSRGVVFVKPSEVRELRSHGMVGAAILTDGQVIPAQMVVAGIGVSPVVDVATDSGLETGDGILVDEYLETNLPGIYAAGDVANYQDVLFGKRRRVEHWDNAVSQGQHCARALLGERKPFSHVPYFFSDVFDLSYEFWGDSSGADEIIYRGDVTTKSFSAWWLRQKTLVAVFAMNRPDREREVAPKWIESKKTVKSGELSGAGDLN